MEAEKLTGNKARYRAYEIIENTRDGDIVGSAVGHVIMVLIILNFVTIIVESFDGLRGGVLLFLRIFEYLSVAVFTLEYLTRLWTADYRFPESKHPYLK
ncbi:MAG: ion transporter [Treponema sp.]|jgi:voltage-gated potassium channel|nr:ion transporter [Treponema sp.]